MRLKVYFILSSCSHLVQWSGTVSAILEEGHTGNIPVKLLQNPSSRLGVV